MTVLARSIVDIKATPREVVFGCGDDEACEDLREACEGAVAKLNEILKALDEPKRKAA